jgi:hypothetical protein
MTRLAAWCIALGLALSSGAPSAGAGGQGPRPVESARLDSAAGLVPFGVRIEAVAYRGRRGVQLTEDPSSAGEAVALVEGSDFGDGVIEIDVAGSLAPGAPQDSRGFVGVVFRSAADASGFENVYLRPTNGRADDQLRRNHSTQYASIPDYPWHRLRRENPGVYESYTDLEAGAWTRLRIEVEGVKARLYVNEAAQPCLIVNDLKRGASRGLVGLWIGQGTEAWFSDLRITRRPAPPQD